MTNEFGRPIVRSGEFPQIALLSDWHCQISKLVCDFATCLAAAEWVLKFDLFAAQVPRLPAIWRQSPDAHLGTVLAPRKLGKGEEDVKTTPSKPFIGALWVLNPTRQSLASSRKRVLRGGQRWPLRSVDSQCQGRAIEPRDLYPREASAWTARGPRRHTVRPVVSVLPGSQN